MAIVWEFKFIKENDLESSRYHSLCDEDEDTESELVEDENEQMNTPEVDF